ncbi:MAG TPA: hypothetical protein VD978_05120 [Azospirillum sp.]|nr:hypothetical protein [Azospirillum sp.]
MSPALPSPIRPVRVHGLADARAALDAATALGVPVLLVGSAAAGALWFTRMVEAARAEFGAAEVTAVLDCADRAGDAQGALAAGVRHVLFTGTPELAARLADIAARTGASVLTSLPPALDLRGARDPAAACRTWLAGG